MAASVNRDRLITHFLDLVRIDSPSFHEHAVADRLAGDLRSLGLEVRNDRSGPGGTGNLVAVLAGTRGMPLALSAHLDTVEPGRGIKPRVENGIVRSDGTTVLGADCKAGLAIITEAIRIVLERRLAHGRLELLLTYGEERGHAGAKTLDLGGLRARLAVVLDGVGPPGTVLAQSPSYESFRATFRGLAAHAGLEPEKGVSALVGAAEAIRRLPLGRLDGDTTANVGLLRGGTARNAVPDLAEMEGEARSLVPQKLDRLIVRIRAAIEEAARDTGTRVELQMVREYQGYDLDESHPGVALALRAARQLGLASRLAAMGGGSDANTFNERCLPSVALGVGMEKPHSLDEHIAVEDVVHSTEYLIELITTAAEAA
jgi:tripeptide aminopeptidase